jgi:type IV pilus assembly protein PilQ
VFGRLVVNSCLGVLIAAIVFSGVPGFAQDEGAEANQPPSFNVSFFEADLVTVLQQLASDAGYNLVTTPEVKGKISVKLTEVSFEQFLKIVCRSRGLIYQLEGRNIYVGLKGQSFDDQRIIGYFHVNYAEPMQMAELVRKIIGTKEDLNCDERTRTIVLNSSKEMIEKASGIIETLDRKLPQITIEVKVIEISTSAVRKLATEWKTNHGSMSWGATSSGAELIIELITGGYSWDFIFKNLITNGNARLVTSPSVSTVDGKEASILIGDKVPIEISNVSGGVVTTTVQYVEVGVKLIFTPLVQNDTELLIDLKTQVNSIGEKVGNAYIIGAREVNSSIQAEIDQTVFLGGLISQKERENISKVPGLGDLPLLGKLFQNIEKTSEETEIILTITPRWNKTMDLKQFETKEK